MLLSLLFADRYPVRGQAASDILRAGQVALFTGAGLLCLVRWRVTGLTRPAFIGVSLLVLGVLAESLTRLGQLLHGPGAVPLSGVAATTAASVAGAVLLVWARRAPAVDAAARPNRLFTLVATAVPLVSAATAIVSNQYGARADDVPVELPMLLLALLWLLVTVSEHRAGLERRAPWLVRVVGLLAVSSAAWAYALWQHEPATGAALLAAAAGAVAVHGAARDVSHDLATQSQDRLRLTTGLLDHEQAEQAAREHEQERLHEVRNILAGIHGATATLRKYEDRLDPGVRRRLEDAATEELRRLTHLLDPDVVAPVVDVDLADTLEPVIVAERQQGAQLRVQLRGTRVRGRAADIATIVSALLVNARRHAPGTRVDLHAEQDADEARVLVEDRGPGVPLAHRSAVFERGERAGATVSGSGLGLYTAQRLANELGGTLRVESRPGGGARFVLTLPTGSATAPASAF